ncbi:MAG: hypothetical protein ABIA67_03245 [Candidatus Margulisiibacteriota bacterium]
MKKLLLIIVLVIVSCILVIAPQARAQQVYLGMYWIAGNVSDPDKVGTDGRQVCFFKELVDNAIVGGYSNDSVGPGGLSGKADQYIMNAFQDWRLTVAPGKYYVAIVQGDDGYGADPVEVNVTGIGYDIAGDLILAKGAGIGEPGPRPLPIAEALPKIEDIRFGKRMYQPALVAKGKEFIVSAQPNISAKVVSKTGLIVNTIAMVLNEGKPEAKTYSIKVSDIIHSAGPQELPTEVSFAFDLADTGYTLEEGTSEVTFTAANAFGSTSEVCIVSVSGGEPKADQIYTYPSPVHLQSATEAIIQYTLNKDMNVEIYMFDVTGRVVKRFSANEREEGGSAGVNKVTWNLVTDQGQKVSSGIYVFTLVNRDTKKLLGKGKFTALP